jgi:beta-galactosidase
VTPVHVFTTGDEGELFLNGRSLGRRRKEPGVWDKAYRLVWDDVRYEPGRLEVVTYRSGREWARDAVETTGEPVRVELEPESGTLPADGETLLFAAAKIVDAHGRVVPRAKDELTFSVEGPAEIVATDNGDETDGTNFTSPVRRAYNGLAQVVVRAKKGAAGAVRISVGARGLGGDAKSVMTR